MRNVNGKARFGRTGEFFSENAKITECYVFDNDRQKFLYHATYDDPTMFTRPFTVTIPLRRVSATARPGRRVRRGAWTSSCRRR